MSEAPGYDYDIFISYAHVDNEPILAAQQGWVDALIRLLSIDLTMKIGRREAFSIWFDEQQLRGNHEINGHISEQVRRGIGRISRRLVAGLCGFASLPARAANVHRVGRRRRS